MEHLHLERSVEKSSRKRKNRRVLVLLSFVLSLIIIGAVLYNCFKDTTNDEKLPNLVLTNNSLAYSIWKQPNFLMKVHLFNYTNWQRVKDFLDDRLHVDDVGPYVYEQQVERVNVQFDGDRLSFQERNTFKYVPEKTTGQIYDEVNVPNLPLIGLISKVVGMHVATQTLVSSALAINNVNHPDAFLKIPVESFLWGYKDNIVDIIKPYLRLTGNPNSDDYGLLVTRNGTVSETFTINTGENDKNRLNIIEKVDGQDRLKYWNSPECDSIEGSDGLIFPPAMLDRVTPIHVFYPNLCRRIAFEYEQDVEISDGIKLLRYRMPRNVFDDPSTNSANQCYCEIDSGTCPPKGVINVTACANGAPELASFPHFSLGDPKLTGKFIGLEPNPDMYDNYVDLHPTLGFAIRGKSSLQLNTQVRNNPWIAELDFMPDRLVLPIAWIEIEFDRENLLPLISSSSRFTPAMKLIFMIVSISLFL